MEVPALRESRLEGAEASTGKLKPPASAADGELGGSGGRLGHAEARGVYEAQVPYGHPTECVHVCGGHERQCEMAGRKVGTRTYLSK